MKTIEFKYSGGTQQVTINTSFMSNKWSVVVPSNSNWLVCKKNVSSITITVNKNLGFKDRTCDITLMSGHLIYDTIQVRQEGYRTVKIEMPEYIFIPYFFYEDKDNLEITVRVHGGSQEIISDYNVENALKKVYDSSDLFEDYVLSIKKATDGIYTFTHKDYEEYRRYCAENNYSYNETDVKKVVTIKTVSEECMNGYAEFEYYGAVYPNTLPKVITVNNRCETTITVNTTYFFDRELNFIKDFDYSVSASSDWVKCEYNNENKKIYLMAKDYNPFSDRFCTLTVKNKKNPSQVYLAQVWQKPTPSNVQ